MDRSDKIMVIGLGILGYGRMLDYKKTRNYIPVLEDEVIEKYQNDTLFHNIIDRIISVLV